MAKLWVTPYTAVDIVSGNVIVPCLVEPPISDPVLVEFTGTAAKGAAALPSGTQYVELLSDTAGHWTLQAQTAAAAATVDNHPMPADIPIVRRIPPGTPNGGWGVSAITRA